MKTKHVNPKNDERGAIVLLMAVALVALIGVASLAIDIGSALVTKAELQNVADAASLAGTRELAVVYKEITATDKYVDLKTVDLAPYRTRIENKAIQFAALNKAGGLAISVAPADVTIGTYDKASGKVTGSLIGPRAASVRSRRDGTSNGTIQTTLARVLGINQIGVTAQSAAAVLPLGSLKAGMGEFPIALDEDWFNSHSCEHDNEVVLFPTSQASCSGWHTFETKPASASTLDEILTGMKLGTWSSPVTTVGKTYYEFIGGTVNSELKELEQVFKSKTTGNKEWHTTIPIYKSAGCDNANQARLIVGFARMLVKNVKAQPQGKVEGKVECGIFEGGELGDGDGTAGDFGTLVSTPGMIQ